MESPSREVLADAIYRALTRYDRELRSMRDLRSAMGGRGPRIQRGTKRAALALYLTDVVLNELKDNDGAQ